MEQNPESSPARTSQAKYNLCGDLGVLPELGVRVGVLHLGNYHLMFGEVLVAVVKKMSHL